MYLTLWRHIIFSKFQMSNYFYKIFLAIHFTRKILYNEEYASRKFTTYHVFVIKPSIDILEKCKSSVDTQKLY